MEGLKPSNRRGTLNHIEVDVKDIDILLNSTDKVHITQPLDTQVDLI